MTINGNYYPQGKFALINPKIFLANAGHAV